MEISGEARLLWLSASRMSIKCAASADPANYEDPSGIFSGENNSIPALQRRGVVVMSCHNAIWEQVVELRSTSVNPEL